MLAGNDAILVVRLNPDPANPKQYGPDAELLEVIGNREPLLEGARTIPLNRIISDDKPVKPRTLIIIGDHKQGRWHWHQGIDSTAETVRCFKGLARLDLKDNQKVLRHSFDFLYSANSTVASAALAEWTKSAPADVTRVAKQLPAAKVRALVQDEKAEKSIRSFAAFLLGHCGEEKDVSLIRRLLEMEETSSRPEAVLKAYVLLRPKEGWAYLGALIKHPERPFIVRYDCLRTARYFHSDHPNLIAKKDIERLFADTLKQEDIADFLIEDFRRWRCWDYTDRVLALFTSKTHEAPVIKRAILRYALCCPDPACDSFVTGQRRRDREWVADTEELLKLEEP